VGAPANHYNKMPLARWFVPFQRFFSEWLTVGLLASSLALNVYLAKRITPLGVAPRPTNLIAGTRAPALYVKDLAGTKTTVEWSTDGSPYLLYIFTPSCVWCQRNLANFQEIVRARGADMHIIGLSLSNDGLKEYISEHGINYPVYVSADAAKNSDFVQNATPTTVMVSPSGKIDSVWRGAYVGKLQGQVEQRLKVHLPGVSQGSQAAEVH
jgi:peroxiredoxin